MNVLIRADSSLTMGVGHISRTLCLSERLRARGGTVTFVCRHLPGNMSHLVSERGFALRIIHGSPADEEEDAAQCAPIVEELQPSWLVADQYDLGAKWHSAGRRSGSRILVIDDLANRWHECDLLVDQNLFFEGASRYEALVPDTCVRLIGPKYALLGEDYAARRASGARARHELGNVLVYFGGGNTADALLKTVEALSSPSNRALTATIVANPRMDRYDMVAEACRVRPNTALHAPKGSLADFMHQADLAIGGGGVTTWERMCLGLPAITAVMADNQRVLAEQLAQRGLIVSLGEAADFTVKALEDALDAFRSPGVIESTSLAVQSICDGRGADRVAEAMT